MFDRALTDAEVEAIRTSAPPVVTASTFNIDENSADNTVVGTVVANDLDGGDTLTPMTLLRVIPMVPSQSITTASLTVANSAALDFETNPVFNLTVEATDDGSPNLSDTTTVTISLADVVEFVVTNTSDGGAGSLRQAIIDANANTNSGGPDHITFNIGADGTPQTINLLSPLDPVSEAVIIDGFSQYGALTPTVPIIEINGASAGAVDGIILDAGSDGSTIQGLIINRFDDAGIKLEDSDNHTIVGNYIGTDAAGTGDRGNFDLWHRDPELGRQSHWRLNSG